MILETKEIFAGYGQMEILKGISISVEPSKITCIIGPNGAGKSTLIKTIFGFIKPRKGRVIFNGEEITGIKPHHALKKGISYLAQGRSVFPYLTILENLRMGGFTLDRKERESAISKAIERFPVLREKKKALACNLSGGEQRMLELGRALMLHPKIILFDEPSIGLAPIYADNLRKRIIETKESGITILMVEQNVREALKMADYAYVLELGQISLEGTGKEVLESTKITELYLGK